MDDDKLDVKPEALASMYSWIDTRARQIAGPDVGQGLRITRDGRIKSRYHIVFSDQMTPHLISAVQQFADSQSSLALKTYFQKLQEHLLAQMFGDLGQPTVFNIRYEGKLI